MEKSTPNKTQKLTTINSKIKSKKAGAVTVHNLNVSSNQNVDIKVGFKNYGT